MQLIDHFAGAEVQGGKQRGGTVTAVVLGAPLRHPGHHRLLAIKCLDLALLVHAQHERPVRRIQLQTDDVAHFLDAQRIGGELEGLGAV